MKTANRAEADILLPAAGGNGEQGTLSDVRLSIRSNVFMAHVWAVRPLGSYPQSVD
jgi:hypothetical protein